MVLFLVASILVAQTNSLFSLVTSLAHWFSVVPMASFFSFIHAEQQRETESQQIVGIVSKVSALEIFAVLPVRHQLLVGKHCIWPNLWQLRVLG